MSRTRVLISFFSLLETLLSLCYNSEMALLPNPPQSYRPYILMFILNLAIVAGILYLLRREEPRPVIVTGPSPRAGSTGAAVQVTQITVVVSGAVNRPGTLKLDSTARLADALQQAGGVRPEADLSSFDLTRALKEDDKITIPARASNPPVANNLVSGTPTARSIAPPAASQKINLNTATQEQLELLPGIGPALAKRILDYRAVNGDFDTIEELQEVRGIGEAIFEELKPLIAVNQNEQ